MMNDEPQIAILVLAAVLLAVFIVQQCGGIQ